MTVAAPDRRGRLAWLIWSATVAAVAVAQIGQPHHTARHYFDTAARLLTDDGPGTGWELFAAHPEFQFGPPAVVAMLPFTHVDPAVAGPLLAACLAAIGLGVLAGLVAIARRLVAFTFTGAAIVGGVAFLATWGDLAFRTAHVDDALAISGLVVAVLLCTRNHAWAAAVVLGLAAAAKPWALGFVVIAAVPSGAFRWLRAVAAAGVAAACWAPFVLMAPDTLDAAGHEIAVRPESALALIGASGGTTPEWCRPAQLVLGLAIAVLLVRRSRWSAAPLAVVTVRLLLDPDVNRYYAVAFVAAALLFEWLVTHPRFPWIAVVGAVVLETTEMLPGPGELAALTRVGFLVCVGAVVWRSRVSPAIQPVESRSLYATASARRVETPSLA